MACLTKQVPPDIDVTIRHLRKLQFIPDYLVVPDVVVVHIPIVQ